MADVADLARGSRATKTRARAAGMQARRVSLEAVGTVIQVIDFVLAVVAGQLAYVCYNTLVLGESHNYWRFETPSLIGAFVMVTVMRRFRIYAPKYIGDWPWQMRNILYAWLVTLALLAVIVFAAKIEGIYSRGWAFIWAALTPALLFTSRIGAHSAIQRWRAEGRLFQRIGLVGAGELSAAFLRRLEAAPDPDITIAGVYDDRFTRRSGQVCGYPIVGTTDDLVAHVREMAIDQILIALPLTGAERLAELINKFRSLPVDVRIVIDDIAAQFPVQKIGVFGGSKTIEVFERPLKHQNELIKLLEDYVLGSILLLLGAPLMLLIALAIRLDSKGPIFFAQERFGFNNKIFRIYKFRTMHVACHDPAGAIRTVRGDPRVTPVGRVLRSLSLDELPQLFNVMRGEMSLVGPRPHAVAMRTGDELYHEAVGDYFVRHRVKPGMTGWAQVNGSRGEIDSVATARERVTYDLQYIDNWSFWLDVKILAMTFWVVLLARNAY